MRHLWKTLGFLVIGWVAPAQAQVLFDENFEVPVGELHSTGPVVDALKAKGWAGFIEANPSVEVASVVSKTSRTGGTTRAIRFRYGFMNHLPSATDNLNVKLTRFHTPVTEFWSRGWYRWEKIDPNQTSFWVKYPTLNNSKQQYFNPGLGETVGGSVGFHTSWAPNELFSHLSTNHFRTCPGGPKTDQTCNYFPNRTRVAMTLHNSPSDRPTEWACVEAHWKGNTPLNTANGVLELYVNNTQTMRYTDINYFKDPPSGSSTNTFRYVQLYRQSAENMFRYEDDFAISTQRIGCNGRVGVSDTTPPATPSNFRVK